MSALFDAARLYDEAYKEEVAVPELRSLRDLLKRALDLLGEVEWGRRVPEEYIELKRDIEAALGKEDE